MRSSQDYPEPGIFSVSSRFPQSEHLYLSFNWKNKFWVLAKATSYVGSGHSGGAAVGWGETASAPVKVILQEGLENISRDRSKPLARLWLEV